MKRLLFVILAIFLVAGAAEAHKRHGHGHRHGSYGLFYGSLGSQGEWIEMSFGTVWRPTHVGHGWRPYMRGRWVWSDYGWYWNSYEPFGWATYHYGRWIYDDYYGWIWVPDDVWGPAWVEWRYDDDYIGWAPLPPYANFSVSVGITFGQTWTAPAYYWNFVPCGNFSSAQVVDYIRPASEAHRIYGRTRDGGTVRSVDRRVYNDGIGLDRVERRSREQVRRVDLVDRANPGEDRLVARKDRDRLEVYRPGPEEVRRSPQGQRDREQAVRERTGQRTPDVNRADAPRERAGQRELEEAVRQRDARSGARDENRARVQQERSAQRDQVQRDQARGRNQVQRERTGQRPQEELQRARETQRSTQQEMRDKVLRRDQGARQREAERGQGGKQEMRGAEKRKNEVREAARQGEVRRPKPESQRRRDG